MPYPWIDGEFLTAADLNAAIAGAGSGAISSAMAPVCAAATVNVGFTLLASTAATINGTLNVTSGITAGSVAATGAVSGASGTFTGLGTVGNVSVTGNPGVALGSSIGNAIASNNAALIKGTTAAASTWENGLSVQLTNNTGHAGAAPKVGLYAAVEATGAAAGDSWAFNPLLLLDSGAVPNAAHQCAEFDINNSTGTNFHDTESSFGPPAVFGFQVTGLSANRCTSAIAILGNITGGSAPMWNRGITLANTCVRIASIQDFTSSTTTLDVWGLHTYGVDTKNAAISGAAMRLGQGQPISWRNAADNADLPVLTMGAANNIELGNGTSPSIFLASTANVVPISDNSLTCGANGFRWSAVWAANGTIQTSDPALKTDIAPLPSMLPLVLGINPVTYRWKSGGMVPVEVQKDVTIQEMEAYDAEEEVVEVVDGVATLVKRTVQREQPAYDEMPVLNADGSPAMTTIPATRIAPAHEVPRIHRQPRMVTKRQTVTEFQERPGNRTHWGFLAPDVKAAFDTLGVDFGGYVKAEDGTQALRPDQLLPVLWKAVQELAAEVAALKAR